MEQLGQTLHHPEVVMNYPSPKEAPLGRMNDHV
jgi:hypothetical protein